MEMRSQHNKWVAEVDFQTEMRTEYAKARSKHPPMASRHEGLAVLWEEFEEVKAEVFKRQPDLDNLRKELVQVATMAMAMALETL